MAPLPHEDHFNSDAKDRAAQIKHLHAKVRVNIERKNVKYTAQANQHRKLVEFNIGDLVWVHLWADHFPPGRYGKLKPRAAGPFKIMGKIGTNAYKVELPAEYEVSDLFNVADLTPFVGDDNEDNSRTSSPQPGVLDTGALSVSPVSLATFTAPGIDEWNYEDAASFQESDQFS